MCFTISYVVIVCVLVKSGFLHTFRSDFSLKRLTFLSSGWHILQYFRLDVSSAIPSSKRKLTAYNRTAIVRLAMVVLRKVGPCDPFSASWWKCMHALSVPDKTKRLHMYTQHTVNCCLIVYTTQGLIAMKGASTQPPISSLHFCSLCLCLSVPLPLPSLSLPCLFQALYFLLLYRTERPSSSAYHSAVLSQAARSRYASHTPYIVPPLLRLEARHSF